MISTYPTFSIPKTGFVRALSTVPGANKDVFPTTTVDVSSSIPSDLSIPSDAITSTVVAAADMPTSMWSGMYVPCKVMELIDYIHVTADIPYWGAIFVAGSLLRLALFPIVIKTMRNGANLRIVQPIIKKLQEEFAANPHSNDVRVRQKFEADVRALFKKHQVNPVMAITLPFLQIPIFLAFFTALSNMHNYYPAMTSGGMFWFTDLSIADPYFIFPLINAVSFLAMVELGADGMNQTDPNAKNFKWGMRALSVAMIPLTMHLPMVSYVLPGICILCSTITLDQKKYNRYHLHIIYIISTLMSVMLGIVHPLGERQHMGHLTGLRPEDRGCQKVLSNPRSTQT